MKASELRDMTIEELKTKAEEFKKESFNLRMQRRIGQLENPMRLRYIRKDIARVKTIIAEKVGIAHLTKERQS